MYTNSSTTQTNVVQLKPLIKWAYRLDMVGDDVSTIHTGRNETRLTVVGEPYGVRLTCTGVGFEINCDYTRPYIPPLIALNCIRETLSRRRVLSNSEAQKQRRESKGNSIIFTKVLDRRLDKTIGAGSRKVVRSFRPDVRTQSSQTNDIFAVRSNIPQKRRPTNKAVIDVADPCGK